MRNTYIRLLVPVFVFVLAIMIAANLPAAKLVAMQGGQGVGPGQGSTGAGGGTTDSGSGAVAPGTSDNPNDSDQGTGAGQGLNNSSPYANPGSVGNAAPGTPGAGAGTVPGDTATTNQAGTDANTGRGLGWGSVILSFIVGLIIGGLIFGSRRTTIDRDNLRRRAS